jgi:hypothetical protein
MKQRENNKVHEEHMHARARAQISNTSISASSAGYRGDPPRDFSEIRADAPLRQIIKLGNVVA